MLTTVVHTIGLSVYFTLFIIFFWISKTPGKTYGAGWISLALISAMLARASLLYTYGLHNIILLLTIYTTLNAIEKPLILIGILDLLEIKVKTKYILELIALIFLVCLASYVFNISPFLIRFFMVTFSVAFYLYLGFVLYRNRKKINGKAIKITSYICFAFSVHWVSVYLIIFYYPAWNVLGFLVGTLLNLFLYFYLLICLLMFVQKRLIEAEAKALDLSFIDALTGLKNRRYIEELFTHQSSLHNRSDEIMLVIYIDLDNFKYINDLHFHKIGDEVLKHVSKRIKDIARSSDICTRIGGDEFIVICTQIKSLDDITKISIKYHNLLNFKLNLYEVSLSISASVGVSVYPIDGNSLQELIDKADKAMYESKNHGKNTVTIYSTI